MGADGRASEKLGHHTGADIERDTREDVDTRASETVAHGQSARIPTHLRVQYNPSYMSSTSSTDDIYISHKTQ